jgi:hypothetical protein
MSTARKQKAGTPYREMKMGQGLGALFGELPLEPSSEKSIAVTLILKRWNLWFHLLGEMVF